MSVHPFLDRPDGLLDGVSGDVVVAAVADDVVDLVCRNRFGFAAADSAQAALLTTQEQPVAAVHSSVDSQRGKVEQAFVLLAEHIAPRALSVALEELVRAVVPRLLEEREKSAHERRALGLSRNGDGTWQLDATLTSECGERLFAALGAEARRDPANPVDTLLREQAREEQSAAEGRDRFTDPDPVPAWEVGALAEIGVGEPCLVPRHRSARLHDAFDRLLACYLGAGLGGNHGKVPVQVTVSIPSSQVEGRPGALPGRGGSGRPLARSLLGR